MPCDVTYRLRSFQSVSVAAMFFRSNFFFRSSVQCSSPYVIRTAYTWFDRFLSFPTLVNWCNVFKLAPSTINDKFKWWIAFSVYLRSYEPFFSLPMTAFYLPIRLKIFTVDLWMCVVINWAFMQKSTPKPIIIRLMLLPENLLVTLCKAISLTKDKNLYYYVSHVKKSTA